MTMGDTDRAVEHDFSEATCDDAVKRYTTLQTVLEHYWRRWSREYLSLLRERERGSFGHVDAPMVGDIVVIYEDLVPRNRWRLGRITRLITATDGVTRGAVVRTANGELQRPVQKLFPVELQSRDTESNDANIVRPRRGAALNADALRRAIDG